MKWSIVLATLLLPILWSPAAGSLGIAYEGYVDPTFNCPATTTCPKVCVANVTQCPTEMLCPDDEELCADGSCATKCTGQEETECDFKCAPISCARVIDTFDQCKIKYKALYEAEAECGEIETNVETRKLYFTEPGFIFTYFTFVFATFSIWAWCFFNQRLSPVPGSTKSLDLDFSGSAEKTLGFQTGYQSHIVGNMIYCWTIFTILYIQVLLGWLSLQYYRLEELDLFMGLKLYFKDEIQLLIAFESLWCKWFFDLLNLFASSGVSMSSFLILFCCAVVGFFWTFSLKFPYSIRSMHYRRCLLQDATHVAIAIFNEDEADATFDESYMRRTREFFDSFFYAFHEAFTFIFSDRNFFGCKRTPNGYFKILRVSTDVDGTRFILFRFRRYNLVEDRFVPGVLDTYETIGSIVKADMPSGLPAMQIESHRRIVGENNISLKKPTYARCLYKELSKPFYTYQNFMVWAWIPVRSTSYDEAAFP